VNNKFRTLGTALALVWASGVYSSSIVGQSSPSSAPTEALAGYDNATNGFIDQPAFDAARATFEEHEGVDEGLGPVYNADSCAGCHSNPVTGAISQVTELRAGSFNGTVFVDQVGGSLINDRAIHPGLQERVLNTSNVRTFRTSLNTLGDGFVEAIADSTLLAIRSAQPASMRGLAIQVPVLEAPGAIAIGRFGWKDQHASLLSFSSDAYLNEMGISNRLEPNRDDVTHQCDTVVDPEDVDDDIDVFAEFMRATKAPPRDEVLAASAAAQAGSKLFDQIGCSTCHIRTIVTAAPGTPVAGGAVPACLGNKIIHPFSDFLLHNLGKNDDDGIVQNGPQDTRHKLRTAPLWGVRTHPVFMHDGGSPTLRDAILRHDGEARTVTTSFTSLNSTQQQQIITFLMSL